VEWTPGVGRPLLELSTIHYARWIVLSSLPHPDGSGRSWLLNWNYLLFNATYDGPKAEYLNTFTDLLPLRIARLFGSCFGFESRVEDAPGADGRVFPTYAFRDFVAQNALQELGFYDRRSEAVRAIRQALAIERVEHLHDHSGPAALRRAQSEVESLALGAPLVEPGWGEALFGPWMRRARPSRSVNALTVAAPLRSDVALKSADPEGPPLTLRSLPSTLFAHLALIPSNMQAHLGQKDPDTLPKDYLLFTSDFYGEPSDYIEELRKHTDIKDIFQRCVGFPGTKERDFKQWLARHSLKSQYRLCGYPSRPVEEFDKLLATRSQIARGFGMEDGRGRTGP